MLRTIPKILPPDLVKYMIRRVIDSGAIGEVTSLTANLGYELENVKRIWAPDLAGGALLDVGCYLVHFARMIFGEQVRSLQSAAVFRNGVDALHEKEK